MLNLIPKIFKHLPCKHAFFIKSGKADQRKNKMCSKKYKLILKLNIEDNPFFIEIARKKNWNSWKSDWKILFGLKLFLFLQFKWSTEFCNQCKYLSFLSRFLHGTIWNLTSKATNFVEILSVLLQVPVRWKFLFIAFRQLLHFYSTWYWTIGNWIIASGIWFPFSMLVY